MIDYINERCFAWGKQIRRVYLGHDGWPSKSILGRLQEEGLLGAASSRFVQHYSECLMGEAVETGNAIKKLSEEHREILFVHYVVIGKGKVKAHWLDLPVRTYYNRLDKAQTVLAGVLASFSQHTKPVKRATENHEDYLRLVV